MRASKEVVLRQNMQCPYFVTALGPYCKNLYCAEWSVFSDLVTYLRYLAALCLPLRDSSPCLHAPGRLWWQQRCGQPPGSQQCQLRWALPVWVWACMWVCMRVGGHACGCVRALCCMRSVGVYACMHTVLLTRCLPNLSAYCN